MDFMKMAKGHVYKKKGVTWEPMNYADDTPRKFVDANGVNMVIHFPAMLRKRGVVRGVYYFFFISALITTVILRHK